MGAKVNTGFKDKKEIKLKGKNLKSIEEIPK